MAWIWDELGDRCGLAHLSYPLPSHRFSSCAFWFVGLVLSGGIGWIWSAGLLVVFVVCGLGLVLTGCGFWLGVPVWLDEGLCGVGAMGCDGGCLFLYFF